jgi:hypothetical protein
MTMKTATKTAAKTATPAEDRPQVEYPQKDETVVSSEYTFRIAAPTGAEGVDVSIDQGPWIACRNEVGHFWYDWSGYDDGVHEVIARVRGGEGRWVVSAPNEFLVSVNR